MIPDPGAGRSSWAGAGGGGRAIAAGVPFGWVAADSVYGVGEVEMALCRAGKGDVLGARGDSLFNSWIGQPPVAGSAGQIAQGLDGQAWRRASAGEGSQRARLARLSDWVCLELADPGADEFNPALRGTRTRGLLVRRSIADQGMAFFTIWCPAGPMVETLVAVEGRGHQGRLRARQDGTRP